MLRQCLLVTLICSFLVSAISESSPAATPKKASKPENVKFKTSLPYVNQFYEGSPCDSQYGYPQGGNCGSNGWPYGAQNGPAVSYPSYGLPQQPYNPYPYTAYNSYQPYQSYQPIPYNSYPQYGGAYQYPLSTGYPTSSYPLGADSASYSPINSATPDLLKLLGGANVVTTIEDTNETYPTLPVNGQQPLSTIYLPQTGFGNNGAPAGNYPLNRYDPFSNVPTDIIDVDYTPGFKASQPSGAFEYPKPIVKVTSTSKQSSVSAQPIVKTQSSVVTMKPVHAVITRVYDSSKGESPTVKVENLSDDIKVNEVKKAEENDVNDIIEEDVKGNEEEDEKPADTSSWFK